VLFRVIRQFLTDVSGQPVGSLYRGEESVNTPRDGTDTVCGHCALLGRYAASCGRFLPTFRDNLWVPSTGVKNLWIPLEMGQTMCPESVLFWVIRQRVVAVSYRHFGTTSRSHLQGWRICQYPWRWDRHCVLKRPWEITSTRCVKTQKSAVLSYFAVEAWNHAFFLNLISDPLPTYEYDIHVQISANTDININVCHCTVSLRQWVLWLKLTERDSLCYQPLSFCNLSRHFLLHFIEPENVSLFLHETATGPYPKPH
jgi:hypothetical protein